MTVVVFVEPDDELSLQAVTLAQSLGDVRAVDDRRPVRAGGVGEGADRGGGRTTTSSARARIAGTRCSRTSPRSSTCRSPPTSRRCEATR